MRLKNDTSRLEVLYGEFYLELKIRSRSMNRRRRRSLGLAILREIIRKYPNPRRASVLHEDDHWKSIFRDENRQVGITHSPDFSYPSGKVGFQVRQVRLRIGQTQTQFALAIGLSRSHLSQIERGKCEVSPLTLRKLQEVTGLTLDYGQCHPQFEGLEEIKDPVKYRVGRTPGRPKRNPS